MVKWYWELKGWFALSQSLGTWFTGLLEPLDTHDHPTRGKGVGWGPNDNNKGFFMSMILPQVHLRKPCYDFSFL